MSGGGNNDMLGTALGIGASIAAPELAPEIFGVGAGAGETALTSMALGGIGSALTGGNVGRGAMMGGIGSLVGSMLPGSPVGTTDVPVSDAVPTPVAAQSVGGAAANSAPMPSTMDDFGGIGAGAPGSTYNSAVGNSMASGQNAATSVGGGAAQQAATSFDSFGNPVAAGSPSAMSADPTGQAAAYQAGASNPNVATSGIGNFLQNNYGKIGAGLAAAYLLGPGSKPNLLPGYTPPSASSYGLGRTLAAGYQPVRPMAGGGLTVGAGSVPTQGVAPSDLMQKPNQGAGLDSLAVQYGISPQMVSQARQTYGFSAGGPTEMAVGGKLLSGHGDGMSDSIKANISGQQEARLADSEFVVPADVVSHLGNGSTDAGAKQLYSMMDRVRKARTGRKAQGRQINPQQYMPA